MEYIDFHTHQPTAEGVISPRSFGIHPWDASSEAMSTYEEFLSIHIGQFKSSQIIGECGLDKARETPWNAQTTVFEWQIRIAAELGKPMVIHCVRAFNELMQMRKTNRGNLWVVHGFTGSPQLAGQLFKCDILVSFGAALLDSRRVKIRETLRGFPYPFLLETDTSECGIEAIYRAAADIRGTTVEKMADTISETYKTLIAIP